MAAATPGIQVDIPTDRIADFCDKWRIVEMALFGSVLREDFGPHSDVDVLVTFGPNVPWTLLDLVRAEEELKEVFGRPVDLVERAVVEQSENWIRRGSILNSAMSIYAR